ncbi:MULTISPECIES: 5-oxoprolinase subunit PxpB [Alphaproteobacteria]|uniref:Allophanate hydrolase n=2 Tax=Alphaproteobacteria TaxID=28211 RepID=A0A512HDQ2_9HYPH|nr:MULTISPECIES: 5-oxoprolinase subunit PxpB [Alphaproteobacteria]GEO83582.1 allophanate hydrolase [Ciceribacter naphthalenivorans]GLR24266.1 allophanate hydrolase [Ciceribacter naphthalenivorans]GLT07122.1 allophanate hydrolase [Sphingomonas psychrolutea]
MFKHGDNPRISAEGAGALLFDVAGPVFDPFVQERIWVFAEKLKTFPGVDETAPGMNNLMVVFDPLRLDPDRLEAHLVTEWKATLAAPATGRLVEVPVVYGNEGGDLAEVAAEKGLTIERLVAMHSAPVYSVAAVGAMPGFVYLSGLDPVLALPRRAVPRMGVPEGSVIIGGTQAGIMPLTAPSGWHILGHTDFRLFDPMRQPPAALHAGDRVRFVVKEINI